jgi:hypothetical protein
VVAHAMVPGDAGVLLLVFVLQAVGDGLQQAGGAHAELKSILRISLGRNLRIKHKQEPILRLLNLQQEQQELERFFIVRENIFVFKTH